MSTKKRPPRMNLGPLPATKAKPAIDEQTARAFAGEPAADGVVAPAQAPRRPDAQAVRPPSKHSTWRRMTVYLPPDLAEELQLRSVRARRDMSDIVADALKAHLAGTADR